MFKKLACTLIALSLLAGCAAAPAESLPAATTETAEAAEAAAPANPGFSMVGNLSPMPPTHGGYRGWNTGDAYYEIVPLHGNYADAHAPALLIKTDYAAAAQTVLCNLPGCRHNSAACPAFIPDYNDMYLYVSGGNVCLFHRSIDTASFYGDNDTWDAYVERLKADYEQYADILDYSSLDDYIEDYRAVYESDHRPAFLEKLNDDLTERTVALTFGEELPAGLYFEYCDEYALYADAGLYSTNTNVQKIIRADLTDGTVSSIALQPDESIITVSGSRFLTARIVSDAPLPDESDDEAYSAALQNAMYEYTWYDPQTLQYQTAFSVPCSNGFLTNPIVYNNCLYVQDNYRSLNDWSGTSSLSYYDMDGNRTEVVHELPAYIPLGSTSAGFLPLFSNHRMRYLWGPVFADNGTETDYIYNLATGAVSELHQRQYLDGGYYGVDLMAETNDGRWMIGYSRRNNNRANYGLIDPETFIQGSEAYTLVDMWDEPQT